MTDKALPKLDWRVVFNRATPPGSRGWGRVRAAQLKQMGPAMTVAAWGQAFNALLICYMLQGEAPPTSMALWLFSVSLLMLYFAQQQRKLRGREIHSLPRPTINRAAYHSIFVGIVWCFPARYFFEHATHGQQLAHVRHHRDDDGRRRLRLRADPGRRRRLCDRHGRRLHAHADDHRFTG